MTSTPPRCCLCPPAMLAKGESGALSPLCLPSGEGLPGLGLAAGTGSGGCASQLRRSTLPLTGSAAAQGCQPSP